MKLRSGHIRIAPFCPCPARGHVCSQFSPDERANLIRDFDTYAGGEFGFITGQWPPPVAIYWCDLCAVAFDEHFALSSALSWYPEGVAAQQLLEGGFHLDYREFLYLRTWGWISNALSRRDQ